MWEYVDNFLATHEMVFKICWKTYRFFYREISPGGSTAPAKKVNINIYIYIITPLKNNSDTIYQMKGEEARSLKGGGGRASFAPGSNLQDHKRKIQTPTKIQNLR